MYDWEDFDADGFFFDVIINGNCDNVGQLLDNVHPTQKNYHSIRDVLLTTGDVIEYVYLLVDKYGTEKIKNDRDLYNKLYDVFDKELLDRIL